METTRVISHFNSGAANNSCTFFIYGSSTARPPTRRGRSRFTPADTATRSQVIKARCHTERPQPPLCRALHTCRTSDFSSDSGEEGKKKKRNSVLSFTFSKRKHLCRLGISPAAADYALKYRIFTAAAEGAPALLRVQPSVFPVRFSCT